MLTEALKGDTTLTELNLGGEDNTKRKRKKKKRERRERKERRKNDREWDWSRRSKSNE